MDLQLNPISSKQKEILKKAFTQYAYKIIQLENPMGCSRDILQWEFDLWKKSGSKHYYEVEMPNGGKTIKYYTQSEASWYSTCNGVAYKRIYGKG